MELPQHIQAIIDLPGLCDLSRFKAILGNAQNLNRLPRRLSIGAKPFMQAPQPPAYSSMAGTIRIFIAGDPFEDKSCIRKLCEQTDNGALNLIIAHQVLVPNRMNNRVFSVKVCHTVDHFPIIDLIE